MSTKTSMSWLVIEMAFKQIWSGKNVIFIDGEFDVNKTKMPKISAERKAIFDEYNAKDIERKRLHSSLYECDVEQYKKLAKIKDIEWVDLEVTGNALLVDYFKGVIRRQRIAAEFAWARQKWWDYFQEVFGCCLLKYWEGNLYGLNVCKLDKEIIKPPDGVSTHDEIKRRYGDKVLTMVEELIHGIKEPFLE